MISCSAGVFSAVVTATNEWDIEVFIISNRAYSQVSYQVNYLQLPVKQRSKMEVHFLINHMKTYLLDLSDQDRHPEVCLWLFIQQRATVESVQRNISTLPTSSRELRTVTKSQLNIDQFQTWNGLTLHRRHTCLCSNNSNCYASINIMPLRKIQNARLSKCAPVIHIKVGVSPKDGVSLCSFRFQLFEHLATIPSKE